MDWAGYFCSADSFLNLERVAGRQREFSAYLQKMPARVSEDNRGSLSPFVQWGGFPESSQKGGNITG